MRGDRRRAGTHHSSDPLGSLFWGVPTMKRKLALLLLLVPVVLSACTVVYEPVHPHRYYYWH
jgi:cell division protein FtsL